MFLAPGFLAYGSTLIVASLVIVFFSPTRVMRSLPGLDAFPDGTKFLPLASSHSSLSSHSQSRLSSDDSFSFPSSVESSILINTGDIGSTLNTSIQRINFEWKSISSHIPHEDILDLWPKPSHVTEDGDVMPTALLERRAAMMGMRAMLAAPAQEVPEVRTKDEVAKSEKPRLVTVVREHHAKTAMYALSFLLHSSQKR